MYKEMDHKELAHTLMEARSPNVTECDLEDPMV